MSEKNNQKFENIYEAFESFIEIFLINQKSIFTGNTVFTKSNIDYIIKNFDENPDSRSNISFDDKIKNQIGEDVEIKELFAHTVWLWGIFASDMKQESKLKDINKWLEIKIKNDFPYSFDHGIGSTGQYHKTNKPLELIYILNFFKKILELKNDNPVKTQDFIDILKKPLKENIEYAEMCSGKNCTNGKKVSMYNILCHLFEPNNYLRAASFSHKEKLVEFFTKVFNLNNDIFNNYKNLNIDEKIKIIEKKCREKFKETYPYLYRDSYKKLDWNGEFDFYNPKFEKIWKNDFNFESKNMILHGAPGTGKTYLTEETIKTRREILGNIEYELVQFHPSYDYEDFIEGIKPSEIQENAQMKFELKNGIFKQMCIDAFKNLIESQNNKSILKTYYFVADEINRAELSRVFGELLLCLEDDKRLKIIDGKVLGTKIKTPNSNLWKEADVVAFINDKDEISINRDNRKEWYFGVPENIYFIGTMNDIDRSVDSFDMALRRRFVWKHYRCDYESIENKYIEDKNIEEYIKSCKNLNNYITNEFNLSDSYELGQAYFMKPKKLIKKELDRVWEENISPILKEYLRAEYPEKEISDKLIKAKKEYKI